MNTTQTSLITVLDEHTLRPVAYLTSRSSAVTPDIILPMLDQAIEEAAPEYLGMSSLVRHLLYGVASPHEWLLVNVDHATRLAHDADVWGYTIAQPVIPNRRVFRVEVHPPLGTPVDIETDNGLWAAYQTTQEAA